MAKLSMFLDWIKCEIYHFIMIATFYFQLFLNEFINMHNLVILFHRYCGFLESGFMLLSYESSWYVVWHMVLTYNLWSLLLPELHSIFFNYAFNSSSDISTGLPNKTYSLRPYFHFSPLIHIERFLKKNFNISSLPLTLFFS